MKLTTAENNAVILKLLRAEGVTLNEAFKRIESKTHERWLDGLAKKYQREINGVAEAKLQTRGNREYSDLRKMLKAYESRPKPELMHKAYGGKPQNFSEAFKSGKARNIHEAISLYTDSYKHVGEKISTWQSERNFLNQDTALVKKARDYLKALGLTIK